MDNTQLKLGTGLCLESESAKEDVSSYLAIDNGSGGCKEESNGSWTASDRFSGCGWVWMDSREDIQLMGTRNFTRCESALLSEVEALRCAMENMLQHSPCQSFGTDCKELIAILKEPQKWQSFATELEKIETLQICFLDFKITYMP
ncbi:unnamed protein product [Brassica rapa]|uniref:RNase H type-1 domain-containing protein n=1 Tax=Brassica campestris TaxID=3711 RepID=A0A8D9GYS4_BRACM|nr:unnamed protein product [Brassica rapa]